jgi:hypothetical protein
MGMPTGPLPVDGIVVVTSVPLPWGAGLTRGQLLRAADALRVRVVPATSPNHVKDDDDNRHTVDRPMHDALAPLER